MKDRSEKEVGRVIKRGKMKGKRGGEIERKMIRVGEEKLIRKRER